MRARIRRRQDRPRVPARPALRFPWLTLAAALVAAPASAVDHNNLDAGRPLRFDDASPIAYREQDRVTAPLKAEIERSLGTHERRYRFGKRDEAKWQQQPQHTHVKLGRGT